MTRNTTTLLTTDEVAERLGLATGTLRNWRTRKTGPAFIRVGGRIRYREAVVEAWLTAQEGAA